MLDLRDAARDVVTALRRVAETLAVVDKRYSITDRQRLQQTFRTIADALEAQTQGEAPAPPPVVKDGTGLHVQAKSEAWHLTFYSDGRMDGDDAVCIDIERDAHNFSPTLTAKEAGALIDALLTLLPAAREHSKLC